MKEYALYKGDNLLAFGTIKEMAQQLDIKPASVRHYGNNSYKRRIKNLDKARILIKIED